MRSDGFSGLSRKRVLRQINDPTSPSHLSPTSHHKARVWASRPDSLHPPASPSPSLHGISILRGYRGCAQPGTLRPQSSESALPVVSHCDSYIHRCSFWTCLCLCCSQHSRCLISEPHPHYHLLNSLQSFCTCSFSVTVLKIISEQVHDS